MDGEWQNIAMPVEKPKLKLNLQDSNFQAA